MKYIIVPILVILTLLFLSIIGIAITIVDFLIKFIWEFKIPKLWMLKKYVTTEDNFLYSEDDEFETFFHFIWYYSVFYMPYFNYDIDVEENKFMKRFNIKVT